MYTKDEIIYVTDIPGIWNDKEGWIGPTDRSLHSRFVKVTSGYEFSFTGDFTVRDTDGELVPLEYTGCSGITLSALAEGYEENARTQRIADDQNDIIRSLRTKVEALKQDLNTIEEFLLGTVKEEQKWCDEDTQEIVDRLNAMLTQHTFVMERFFDVSAVIEGTLYKPVTLRIKAASQEEAEDIVRRASSEGEMDSLLDGIEDLPDTVDEILTDAARNIPFENIDVSLRQNY